MTWPERGRCGACGRPAQRFPSLRWEHDGRPCALRHRTVWSPSEVPLPPAVFIPDGQDLPVPDPRGHWRPITRELLHSVAPAQAAVPDALGWIEPSTVHAYWDQVRARLAADAERPEAVDS